MNSSSFMYDVTNAEEVSFQHHLRSVFFKMAIAMLITAATSYSVYIFAASGHPLSSTIFSPISMLLFAVVELGLTITISAALMKIKPATLSLLFFIYSFVSGITFSTIFITYDFGVITTAFLFTAVLFVCCAVIGLTTNIDLSKLGGILFAGLLCLIIVSIASFFIPVLRQSLIISYAGVIIFLLYTAYDIQRIRVMYEACRNNSDYLNRFSTYGAFQLYLDFINLFLNIIRIISSSRSSRD